MAVRQLYVPEPQTAAGGRGGLADIYKPADGKYGYVNITKDYPWTISENAKLNAGRVILKEYQVNESTIKRQALFYTTAAQTFGEAANRPDGFFTGTGEPDILRPYEELFPKDRPTGFVYDFPYFDGINFELYSQPWASLDILESLQKVGASVESGLTKLTGTDSSGMSLLEAVRSATGLAAAAIPAALATAYPKVGIMDRPRLWQGHSTREINLVVPLYNTLNPDDWENNRQLCELLINQNLYNKRDFITSIPPVFYEVLAIGQHYSWASCVTKITIYNKGNIRQLTDSRGISCNVPDVYEINLTLTDMVMQSKNLFQSLKNPTVISSIVQSGFVRGANLSEEEAAIGRGAAVPIGALGSGASTGLTPIIGPLQPTGQPQPQGP